MHKLSCLLVLRIPIWRRRVLHVTIMLGKGLGEGGSEQQPPSHLPSQYK